MARKQEIKLSEAKIIVYLANADNRYHYVGAIAAKLRTDYGYMLKLLKEMHEKAWVRKEEQGIKSYYFLTKVAPLEAAKEVLL